MRAGSWGRRTRCLSGLCTAAKTTARLPTMSSAPGWRPASTPRRYTPCVVFLLSRMDRGVSVWKDACRTVCLYLAHSSPPLLVVWGWNNSYLIINSKTPLRHLVTTASCTNYAVCMCYMGHYFLHNLKKKIKLAYLQKAVEPRFSNCGTKKFNLLSYFLFSQVCL